MQKRIWYVLQNSIRKVEYNEQYLKVPLFFGPRTSLCMYTLMSTMLHKYGREKHYDTNRQSLDFLTNKKLCIALVVINEEKKNQEIASIYEYHIPRRERSRMKILSCAWVYTTGEHSNLRNEVKKGGTYTSKNSQPIHYSCEIIRWTCVSTVKGRLLVLKTNNIIALKMNFIRLHLYLKKDVRNKKSNVRKYSLKVFENTWTEVILGSLTWWRDHNMS